MARLVVVSNRVAVPGLGRDSRAGGLEVAIRRVLRRHPGIWFGWSGQVAARPSLQTLERGNQTYVLTDLVEDDYQEYYNGYANRVLWPILHYRLDLAEFSHRDLTGYMRVNQHFATELHKLLKADDVVWVHDYHLLPLARELRALGHRNKIGFFLHTTFPPPEILTALPSHEQLIPAMCAYDLVGFQTEVDAANFERYGAYECPIGGCDRHASQSVDWTARVGIFPVGVETAQLNRMARRAAQSPFAHEVVRSLANRAMIIGVDRLDYSKGILLRMEAFQRFLAGRADWRGKVTYVQIAPKSRSEIQKYVDIERQVSEAAGRINGTYGEVSWTPIRYVNRAYSRSALAGLYRSARVALVTPLRDGMNLVAKEYVSAQDPENPGVLILSRFAGAAAECKAALLVNPHDPEAVGAAIAEALSMPLAERRERHEALFHGLLKNDIESWGEHFLSSLMRPFRKRVVVDMPISKPAVRFVDSTLPRV